MSPRSRTRKVHRRRRRRQGRQPKSGDAYQNAVALVARSIDPAATVEVGQWVEGPDGRRDLDVAIRPRSAKAPATLVIIECKDWNRPIGIGFIDALESKRRDIGANVAMICSNSGFTSDALRKAARVGIPALAALIEGDGRIRVEVREEIYTRKINFLRTNTTLHFQDDQAKHLVAAASVNEITFGNRQLEPWVGGKCLWIASLSTASRVVVATYRFRQPVPLDIRGAQVLVTQIVIRTAFRLQWCSQVVRIGASRGMYDYLRRRVIMGPGEQQYHLKDVDFEKWVPLEEVPPELLVRPGQRPNTDRMTMVSVGLITGLPGGDPKDAAELDQFVESEQVVDEDGQMQDEEAMT